MKQTLVDVAGPIRSQGRMEKERWRTPIPAVRRLLAEAGQGCPVAQRDLGLLYLHGLGVPEDEAEALRWLLRASAQGDGRAQFYAGHMYESRARIDADLVEAYKWYSVAAERGMPLGQAIFESLEQRMTAEEVYEAEQPAHEFRPKVE